MSYRTRKNIALGIIVSAALTIGSTTALLGANTPAPSSPPTQGQVGRRVTISGVVNGPNNQPVANARVILVRAGRGEHAERGNPTTRPSAGSGAAPHAGAAGAAHELHPVGETQTDSQGRFTFNNILPGNYGVLAGLRGVGRAHERVTVTTGAVPPIILTLAPRPEGANGPTTKP
jgi:protocatechuate 3,4-dioxygenase beta subunit